MKCEICGQGVADNVSLYRANEKGVKAIWRCEAHIDMSAVDSEVKEIVGILEQDMMKGKSN